MSTTTPTLPGTKLVRILCRHVGENATTAKMPVGVYDPELHDSMLAERIAVCASSDFDMLTTTALYEVREIELPEWLDPAEYLRNQIRYEFAWNAGNVSRAWPESWQRGLMTAYLGAFHDMYYVAGLLARNPDKMRSAFLMSVRTQIITWLEQDPAERKYATPISMGQLSGLRTRREFEGKNASERFYWHSQYNAAGTLVTTL